MPIHKLLQWLWLIVPVYAWLSLSWIEGIVVQKAWFPIPVPESCLLLRGSMRPGDERSLSFPLLLWIGAEISVTWLFKKSHFVITFLPLSWQLLQREKLYSKVQKLMSQTKFHFLHHTSCSGSRPHAPWSKTKNIWCMYYGLQRLSIDCSSVFCPK